MTTEKVPYELAVCPLCQNVFVRGPERRHCPECSSTDEGFTVMSLEDLMSLQARLTRLEGILDQVAGPEPQPEAPAEEIPAVEEPVATEGATETVQAPDEKPPPGGPGRKGKSSAKGR